MLLSTTTVGPSRSPAHDGPHQAIYYAGVDPFNKWIDRNSDDNIKAVGKAEFLEATARL